MSRFVAIFITFLILFCSFASVSYGADISARHYALLEAESKDTVCESGGHIKAPMASTTKIMTAILAIENGDPSKTVVIPKEATGIEGSSIYLKEGESLTLEELTYALMLESANDAAMAIAIEIGGSLDGFVEMMNEKAYELGLGNTHFTNPHGLDNEEHYTTAYDLARLATYAMENPVFKEIVSTKKKVIPMEDGCRVLINHNKLLRLYDGAIGVKTGFTKRSGRCLVSCAERDGVRLICVTLNAPGDWCDHKKLLDYGFTKYERLRLADEGDYTLSLSLVNGEKDWVLCSNLESLSLTVRKDLRDEIRAVTEYDRLLCAPIKKGDRIGQVVFYQGENKIGECPLYALESVKSIKYRKSILERIFG